MEQEVLKAFLSGNPLDWFYQHIKKGSFLNQIKDSETFPKFVVIGYIKEIQRAKKKGFFIKIEDISGDWEFFTKDVFNLQRFDLIILYGSKNNGRVYIDKLIKTSYEKLKKIAWWRFDPDRTVVRAKKERYGDIKKQELEKIKAEIQTSTDVQTLNQDSWTFSPDEFEDILPENSNDYETETVIDEEVFDEEVFDDSENMDEISEVEYTKEPANQEEIRQDSCKEISLEAQSSSLDYIRQMPENMEKIQKLILILKNHQWLIEIMLGGKKYQISEQGIAEIQKLLG